MKTLDRNNLAALNADINAALKSVAEKHGISIKTGATSFNAQNATVKLMVAVIGEGGTVESKERSDFKKLAPVYFGLKVEDLDKTIQICGNEYKIAGLAPRGGKYPIIGERPDGKRYKLPLDLVKAAIEIADKV